MFGLFLLGGGFSIVLLLFSSSVVVGASSSAGSSNKHFFFMYCSFKLLGLAIVFRKTYFNSTIFHRPVTDNVGLTNLSNNS